MLKRAGRLPRGGPQLDGQAKKSFRDIRKHTDATRPSNPDAPTTQPFQFMSVAKLFETLKEEFFAVLPPTIFFFVALNIVALIHVLMLRGTGISPQTSISGISAKLATTPRRATA